MKMTLFAVLFLTAFNSAQASENILVTPMNQVSQSELAPVELTPLAQPSTLGSTSYNFGFSWVNSLNTATFKITNVGTGVLTYRQAAIYGIAFGARHNCTGVLLPNQSCRVRIEFWPHQEGFFSGQFQLKFNEDLIVIDLWGNARR